MFYILRGIVLLLGPALGFGIGHSFNAALVGLGIAAIVIVIEMVVEKVPLEVIVFGGIGAGAGLIVAKVLDWMVFKVDNPDYYRFMSSYSFLVYPFLAILGFMIAIRKKDEVELLEKNLVVKNPRSKDAKVLDTSSLIDGRIVDVVETGFISGHLIVPRFILQELQTVADSADATKRTRGRRGLDILKRLQDNPEVNIKIYDKDFSHIKEVDSKLMELAKQLDAKIATTDLNLSKVAILQGIQILNVNDLAAALKSVVLPGDDLMVFLVKEGKEKNQAIGYLDDGTMIVVDEGRRHIAKRVQASVSSILQTPAGRMIFARVHEGRESAHNEDKQPDISTPPITA
ncbi:MAG: PIN/TRAM domain-containing protein [Elusimicrobiota bacterium]